MTLTISLSVVFFVSASAILFLGCLTKKKTMTCEITKIVAITPAKIENA